MYGVIKWRAQKRKNTEVQVYNRLRVWTKKQIEVYLNKSRANNGVARNVYLNDAILQLMTNLDIVVKAQRAKLL